MAKCFLTGVDIHLNQAFILDFGAANRAVRELRQQLGAVERLLAQLGPRDHVKIFSYQQGEVISRLDRRVVSQTIAQVFSKVYEKENLFVSWPDWLERKTVNNHKTALRTEKNRLPKDNILSISYAMVTGMTDYAIVAADQSREGEKLTSSSP